MPKPRPAKPLPKVSGKAPMPPPTPKTPPKAKKIVQEPIHQAISKKSGKLPKKVVLNGQVYERMDKAGSK